MGASLDEKVNFSVLLEIREQGKVELTDLFIDNSEHKPQLLTTLGILNIMLFSNFDTLDPL